MSPSICQKLKDLKDKQQKYTGQVIREIVVTYTENEIMKTLFFLVISGTC